MSNEMDGVYKLLNREFCQKNQELKILLDREHRINADLQNELRQEKEINAGMQNHIRQLCKLTTTFTGGFSCVFNEMRMQGILPMEHAREPSIPVRRRSTLRRSATPNDSHEQAKTSANLSGLNHSYENSSAASSSSSSTSSTSKKSKRSHPDVTLPEILEIPHQIQQINHSDTIEEADESDHNTTIFDESMEVEENQESENTKDPEESEMPIKEKQQVHHHHADEDQLLYTIREEDSIMLNDLSVIDKENASGIINVQESMVITRHSKLTRENVRLATFEPMVVIEAVDDDESSFESHEDHILGNETINKNHSILQKAASTPLIRHKEQTAFKSSPKTPSSSVFSLTLEKIKVSPSTLASYNSQNMKFEESDTEAVSMCTTVKKEPKATKAKRKDQKPVVISTRPKRKAKPSIGSLIERSVKKKIRRSK